MDFNFGLPHTCDTGNAVMRRLMSMEEWLAIADAGELSHRTRNGDSRLAEGARERAGYAGLGPENFTIRDQRPLVQGGDHSPLD